MARVDFAYGASHKLNMACHTTARHVNAGHKIAVYCSDPTKLKKFNLLLWNFEPTSFISHCLITDPLAKHAQVLLLSNTEDIDLLEQKEWLLNLDKNIPDRAANFERILEIVSNHDEDITNARTRWQAYKKMGFNVKGHKL